MSAGAALSDQEFGQFRELLYRTTGISLGAHKKPLVAGRLMQRLRHHGLSSYQKYYELATGDPEGTELQVAVDLLTTNETYFYREPRHFDFLREAILPGWPADRPFRVWSAACSSGEEAYTLAMVLAGALGLDAPWEVLGSDISSRVLEQARRAQYLLERGKNIPAPELARYCLKGVGPAAGQFRIQGALRERVRFAAVNLNAALPEIGEFDVIFLRNVMIYFNIATKREVVARLVRRVARGGYLIVSHSESLHGVTDDLEMLRPSIYRRA